MHATCIQHHSTCIQHASETRLNIHQFQYPTMHHNFKWFILMKWLAQLMRWDMARCCCSGLSVWTVGCCRGWDGLGRKKLREIGAWSLETLLHSSQLFISRDCLGPVKSPLVWVNSLEDLHLRHQGKLIIHCSGTIAYIILYHIITYKYIYNYIYVIIIYYNIYIYYYIYIYLYVLYRCM